MDFRQEMELFLRARFTVIWVVTHEEGSKNSGNSARPVGARS